MGIQEMTSYERRAWEESLRILHASQARRLIPQVARDRLNKVKTNSVTWAKDLPGADRAMDIAEGAFKGALALTFEPALRSVEASAVVHHYAEKHPGVRTMGDVRALQLEDRDAEMPSKLLYTALGAGQGAATAAAVTGTEIATTVAGGTTAAVAIGAVVTDVVASLALMGRVIGDIAIRYGYNVSLPEEELYALGVLSLGSAGSMSAKAETLAALSRLTQMMMRRATWERLQKEIIVRVIARAYQTLGLRLTQRKLAQTVPIFGIVLNATLTAQLVDHTFQRAQAVYRLRTLSEKYNIDPDEWMKGAPGSPQSGPTTDDRIADVVEILEEEIARTETTT